MSDVQTTNVLTAICLTNAVHVFLGMLFIEQTLVQHVFSALPTAQSAQLLTELPNVKDANQDIVLLLTNFHATSSIALSLILIL